MKKEKQLKVSKNPTGQEFERVALSLGWEVQNGSKHKKIYAPDGQMMCFYEGELAKGTACAIKKWFAGFGILLVLAIGIGVAIATGYITI